DPGRAAWRGRCHRRVDDPLPAFGHPVQLFRSAAPALAAWRPRLRRAGAMTPTPHPGRSSVAESRKAFTRPHDGSAGVEGMRYLESVPRRMVTLYLPLAIFLFVLLFPF